MENESRSNSVEDQYNDLLSLEPKLITNTVPSNGAEQKELFLSGEIGVPVHMYPKLNVLYERIAAIKAIGNELRDNPAMEPKFLPVYESFVSGYQKKTVLMQLMARVKSCDASDKQNATSEFMKLNIELYGEPDKNTYISLLQDKMVAIRSKELSDDAAVMLRELDEMIPTEYMRSEKADRFKPAEKTVKWMQDATNALYGSMLSHIPDKASFDVNEVRNIFESILRVEFGESATDWVVDVEDAKSVNVKSPEKRIVIPIDRGELTHEQVCRLVVHEIGVHVLRSVTGEQTNLGPLRTGLNDYYDVEEGLGMVMEQALVGKFAEAGVDHYITTGAAYHDLKDFREVYEMKWRLGVLTRLEDEELPSEDLIARVKKLAYGATMRIFRGTDELPWFKDLAYYNGSAEVWKYLESIKGDDQALTLLLMGKLNTTHDHLQTILETKTV